MFCGWLNASKAKERHTETRNIHVGSDFYHKFFAVKKKKPVERKNKRHPKKKTRLQFFVSSFHMNRTCVSHGTFEVLFITVLS